MTDLPHLRLSISIIAFVVSASFYSFGVNRLRIMLRRPRLLMVQQLEKARVVFFRYKLRSSTTEGNDEICFSLARTLRAGRTLETSVLEITKQYPQHEKIGVLTKVLNKGVSFTQAINFLIEEKQSQLDSETKLFLSAIYLANLMGGNSARIFERIGNYYSSIYQLRKDTKSSIVQVKMSAITISLLPIFLLLLSVITGSGTLTFLFTNPLGLLCLWLGIILETAGIFWMRKLINKEVTLWIS